MCGGIIVICAARAARMKLKREKKDRALKAENERDNNYRLLRIKWSMRKNFFILLLTALFVQACFDVNQVPNTPDVEIPASPVMLASPVLSVPASTPVSTAVEANIVTATSTPVLSLDFWKEFPVVEIHPLGLIVEVTKHFAFHDPIPSTPSAPAGVMTLR